MKKLTYLILSAMLVGCSTPKTSSKSNGSIIFDTLGTRPLQIYLPPAYDPAYVYPVVYFHDGQNIFLDSTSYAGEWKIDETLDSLIAADRIEPLIAVGIYNSPQRAEEYVPFNDSRIMEMMGMQSWNGAQHLIFADFIELELLPYIEETYGASSSREDRAIFGSSLGGINVLWLGLDYSNAFSFVGAFSPSVWIGDGAILRDMEIVDSIPDDKVWIDHGELEFDPRNIALVKDLEAKGMTYGENLWYYEHKGAQHNEKAWSQRVVSPLLLFKGKPFAEGYALRGEILKAPVMKGKEPPIVRANAFLQYESGVFYSLLDKADYSSPEMAVESDGTIPNPPDHPATIEIEYAGKKVTVQYE